MQQTIIAFVAEQGAAKRVHDLIDAAIGDEVLALSLFETEPDSKLWRAEIFIASDEVDQTMEALKSALGGDLFGLTPEVNPVVEQDWVTQSLQGLQPVRAGRFIVHGDHDRQAPRAHEIAVEINAGQAFGTGHHGTTAGCLDMVEWLLKRTKPEFAFDVGTGSGVLAIALAKAARIQVLASDMDVVSTKVAAENARLNGVHTYVETFAAVGLEDNRYRQMPPAPLIIANILAGPLAALAPSMEWNLAAGGHLVLSGLLPHQRSWLLAAYRAQGLYHLKSHYRNGWLTLVLKG
ncbi:MAG: 50S ribosomal protein L11 methyltransferase [Pseudomonadota bacterium]